ncbi:hypothetical protein LZ30DRAFT_181786 [Colletotrichum cereale]|nr:hypothetical protein LZ30DRAFT_181786 [Colletotrichum cereale]
MKSSDYDNLRHSLRRHMKYYHPPLEACRAPGQQSGFSCGLQHAPIAPATLLECFVLLPVSRAPDVLLTPPPPPPLLHATCDGAGDLRSRLADRKPTQAHTPLSLEGMSCIREMNPFSSSGYSTHLAADRGIHHLRKPASVSQASKPHECDCVVAFFFL